MSNKDVTTQTCDSDNYKSSLIEKAGLLLGYLKSNASRVFASIAGYEHIYTVISYSFTLMTILSATLLVNAYLKQKKSTGMLSSLATINSAKALIFYLLFNENFHSTLLAPVFKGYSFNMGHVLLFDLFITAIAFTMISHIKIESYLKLGKCKNLTARAKRIILNVTATLVPFFVYLFAMLTGILFPDYLWAVSIGYFIGFKLLMEANILIIRYFYPRINPEKIESNGNSTITFVQYKNPIVKYKSPIAEYQNMVRRHQSFIDQMLTQIGQFHTLRWMMLPRI